MLEVSDYLAVEQKFTTGKRLPSVSHEVALETTGPALAAVMIASLLEGSATKVDAVQRMILDLCVHIRGRKGNDSPNQGELRLAGALGSYVSSGAIHGPKRKLVVEECHRIADERQGFQLSGNSWEDWLGVRRLLADSKADAIRQVAEDAKYVGLLHKGATLRSRLSELWRATGGYAGAASAIRDALLQEHFSASTKVWRGVHVMTIHKSKGKEFDEVLVYERSHHGRIVRADATPNDVAQARLALRVAITRAMKRATILTPKNDVCVFL
jgi:DNA helicase-2/ATP-dependent DNA helicase PcrA